MLSKLKDKKCLIFTAQDHHVAKTVRIVKTLQQAGAIPIYLTSQNGNNEFSGDFELPLIKKSISYQSLNDFLDVESCIEIKYRAEECLRKIKESETQNHIYLNNYFSDHGLQNSVYESAENFILMKKAYDIIKPDFCLVLYEGNFWTKVFTYLARKFNIPIFSFQEGMYTREEMLLPAVGSTITEYSTNLFIWGELSKECLSQSAPNPEKLIITGSPHADELYDKMKNFNINTFIKDYSLTTEKKIVTLLLPSVLSSLEKVVQTFSSLSNKLNFQGILKFRPAGNLDEFVRLKNQYETSTCKFLYDEDTYEIILGSDLIISGNSTAGYESILLGKKLIYLEDVGQKDLLELGSVAIGTNNLLSSDADTEKLISHALTTEDELIKFKSEKYLEKIIYKFDGKACDRIANLIAEII